MPSKRRGFIGIFSQNNEPDSNDPEVDSTDSKLGEMNPGHATEKDTAPEPEISARQDSTDSDWDDIFGESAAMEIEPPEPPAINPVAAAVASEKADQTTRKSGVENQKPNQTPINPDLSTPMQAPETKAKLDKSTSAQSAHHNPNYTPMHHAPSPKSILSKTDRQAVADAIQTLREKLSFTRQASSEQRESLIKLGQTGRSFVDHAMKVVNENPDALPRSFDDESFVTDVELIEALRLIGEDLRDLSRRVEDTQSNIASSAFAGALVVHRCGTGDGDKAQIEAYRKSPNGAAQPAAATNGVGV